MISSFTTCRTVSCSKKASKVCTLFCTVHWGEKKKEKKSPNLSWGSVSLKVLSQHTERRWTCTFKNPSSHSPWCASHCQRRGCVLRHGRLLHRWSWHSTVLCPLSSCSAAARPESPGASPSPPKGTTISAGGCSHSVHFMSVWLGPLHSRKLSTVWWSENLSVSISACLTV